MAPYFEHDAWWKLSNFFASYVFGALDPFYVVFNFEFFLQSFVQWSIFWDFFPNICPWPIFGEFFAKFWPASNYLEIFSKIFSSNQLYGNLSQNIVEQPIIWEIFLKYCPASNSLWGSSFSKYARDGADASWKGYREGVKLIFAPSVTFG